MYKDLYMTGIAIILHFKSHRRSLLNQRSLKSVFCGDIDAFRLSTEISFE